MSFEKDIQFDNFVVTGGTGRCHYDKLRCHQWRQSYQSDDILFSVYVMWVVTTIQALFNILCSV